MIGGVVRQLPHEDAADAVPAGVATLSSMLRGSSRRIKVPRSGRENGTRAANQPSRVMTIATTSPDSDASSIERSYGSLTA